MRWSEDWLLSLGFERYAYGGACLRIRTPGGPWIRVFTGDRTWWLRLDDSTMEVGLPKQEERDDVLRLLTVFKVERKPPAMTPLFRG